MSRYIAIDGGTSNTRVYYVCDSAILGVEKIPVGVRDGACEPMAFRSSIRDRIEVLTKAFGTAECILVAGMLTSELGLYNLPHIAAPAGICELHAGIHRAELSDISNLPFYFIPGVKLQGNNVAKTDMMRGEECEFVGLWDETLSGAAFVLPGSHSKIILSDENGRITDFVTLLSGEMVAALSGHTILKNAVDLNEPIVDDLLLDGYHYAANNGLNEALFKVRVMRNVFESSISQCSSFFLGAILSGEIKRILNFNGTKIVISGQVKLKKATAFLLKQVTDLPVELVPDDRAETAFVDGMIKIFEYGEVR